MFTLPDLPYDYDALEPYIDEETMRIHHDKHHAFYIDNLNKLNTKNLTINELLRSKDQSIVNNAGGYVNHSFFWQVMTPKSFGPGARIMDALNSTFGSLEVFKEEFMKKAMGVFGSGWAFLIKDTNGKLLLKRHSLQNSPLMRDCTPILGIDLWEHAYYLKYQNRKTDYINAWWNVINWEKVEQNFSKGL